MKLPERIALDWEKPSAEEAARILLGLAPPAGGIDLSGCIAIVPTQESGRRLREALARLAGSRGVVSPAVLTPGQFLAEPSGAASPVVAALFLSEALSELGEDGLLSLFPNGIPIRGLAQKIEFSRIVLALRAGLAEAGLDFGRTRRLLGETYEEADRWADLERLETAYRHKLAEAGLADKDDARLARAARFQPEPHVREIVLLGISDPQSLLIQALERLSIRIIVATFGPLDGVDRFDAWGRPIGELWEAHPVPWDDFAGQVRRVPRTEDTAATIDAILPGGAVPDGAKLAIGILDRETLPYADAAITQAGGKLHDPEGRPAASHWLAEVLNGMAGFLADPTLDAAVALLRSAPAVFWLKSKRPGFSLEDALRRADAIRAEHFPDRIEQALAWCEEAGSLRFGLETLSGLARRLESNQWADLTREFLAEVIRAFLPETKDLAATESVARAIGTELDKLAGQAARFERLSAADWMRLLVASLSGTRTYSEAGESDVEAAGWLELPWTEAPHLILAGFNQGFIPESVTADPFLPDRIRERLGLVSNRSRFVRDLYFFCRILALRQGGRGRTDVLVVQLAENGDPRLPSRLLFQCPSAELPGRVKSLFREPEPPQPEPAWTPGWMPKPRRVPLDRRIRVTGFRDYLNCPFQFYLRFGLRMERFEPAPIEMDAAQFGTLIHDVLERFALDPALRESTDAAEIRNFVAGALEEIAAARFGEALPLPLLVQVEAARMRLLSFADRQARERLAGWQIVEAERTFEDALGRNLELDGWMISGRFDRLDHHPTLGLWRVLDYKTSDTAKPPQDAHLAPAPREDDGWPPEYARLSIPGANRERAWRDLQLPIYRQLLVERGIDSEQIQCGYFNLSKAVGEAGIAIWEGLDAELAGTAMRCARGVIADLEAGRFWPPNSKARFDSYDGFFNPAPERVADGSELALA